LNNYELIKLGKFDESFMNKKATQNISVKIDGKTINAPVDTKVIKK
jgi:hypothetical protein